MKKLFFLILLISMLAGSTAWAENRGGAIIFVTGDGGRRDIMLYEPDGATLTPLATEKGVMETQPTLGPKGETAWVRRVGQDWELLKNGEVVSKGPLALSPAFRPDGLLAAAISGNEETSLYLFNDKSPSLLVKGDGMAVSPVWSPDGSKMAYVSDETGQGQICLAGADGANARLLLASPVLNTDPAWSPDGRLIAFVSDETDIFVINPEGGGLKQLTQNQGVNRRPCFSPDGAEIVFSSDRDGLFRLYTMKTDGSDPEILIPDLNEPQHAPYWGPVPPPIR